MAAGLIGGYAVEEANQRQALRDDANSVRELFRVQIERDAAAMRSAIQGVTNDATLHAAMARGDRQELLRRVQPLFEDLRAQQRIIRFSFIAPDFKTVLRLHAPEQEGGTAERPTLRDAADKGSDSYGLELSPLGTLTLRTVTPWHDSQGKLIGYIELGEEVGPMADEIKRVLGLDMILLIRKDLMTQEKWEEGQRKYARHDSWDELISMVAVGRTTMSIPGALAVVVEEGSHPSKVVLKGETGKQVAYVSFLPLTDTSGQEIGEMVLLRDATLARQTFGRIEAMAASAGLLVAMGAAIALLVLLKRAERGLRQQEDLQGKLRLLSTGSLERGVLDLTALVTETAHRTYVQASLPQTPTIVDGNHTAMGEALCGLLESGFHPRQLDLMADEKQAVIRILYAPEPQAAPPDRATMPRSGHDFASALTVATHVARLHGSDWVVENEADGGMRLSMTLPLRQTPERQEGVA